MKSPFINRLSSQNRFRFRREFAALVGAIVLVALPSGVNAAERLDRGVVAVALTNGNAYVSWRLLASDPTDTTFDVLRSDKPGGAPQKLNKAPLRDGTNFEDTTAGGKRFLYSVRAITSGKSTAESPQVAVDDATAVGGVRTIKLQGNYRALRVAIADLNGDGALDYVVKHPDFNTDPYQRPGYWKLSTEPYKLEAYRHDGAFMWRYDMGWAIETGIWYSPVLVYDIDGDGKAEVYCKAGEGDPRESTGHVRRGPEFLVKLDGETGKVLQRIAWPEREGFGPLEGDNWDRGYNYSARNFIGVAYLDGERPHLLIERGTYTLIKFRAYDPALTLKWSWESSGEHARYSGQGSHGLQIADIDDDGRDEIVFGSAALDDDGKPLWNTGRGHPDICYVADIDPQRPGLEVFYGLETKQQSNGVCLVEARTGKTIWGYDGPTTHVHSQGMVGDIDPNEPGIEGYGGEQNGSNYWVYSAQGKRLSNQSIGDLAPKAVYWTGDGAKVIVSRGRMFHFNGPTIGEIRGEVVALADCLGDWREELITRADGEIRIHTTTIPAKPRRVCLMQDRQYRTGVAMQTMGYFYPPQTGGRIIATKK